MTGYRFAIGLAAAVAIGAATTHGAITRREKEVSLPGPGRSEEVAVLNRRIAFYQAHAARDPQGARDLAMLSGLYLQRARETGNPTDLTRAEAAARDSYGRRQAHNDGAELVLATSLLGQHRYTEAYEIAARLVASDSTQSAFRGLLAELQLELGRYEEAGRTFATLSAERRTPGMATRWVRWLELQGRTEEAHRLLVEVNADVQEAFGVTPEQAAWFQLRVGDLALRNGHLNEAESAFRSGLRMHPGDYRLLAAQARLEACRHRWAAAVAYGEAAVEQSLDPATLGLVGDAYQALGDSATSADYYAAMETSVLQQPGGFHRAWSLFLLDHDRHVPKVLSKLQEEITVRQDIYGYDLLAWALYKTGRYEEASAASDRALRLGTRDALLFFHAGMIARARGHDADARDLLTGSLEVNASFDPFQPVVARAVLDSLERPALPHPIS